MQNHAGTPGFIEFFTLIYKHRFKFMLTFLLVVFSVGLITSTIKPVYKAKSKLLVKFGREFVYRPEVGNIRPERPYLLDGIINSEIQIITSRDLYEKVITNIGLDTMYPEVSAKDKKMVISAKMRSESLHKPVDPMTLAIRKFKNNLSVNAIPKSNVIEISFTHNDPEIATNAVNLLVDLFREKHLEVFSDSKSSFLETQLAGYQERLEQSEFNLERFKQKYEIYSMNEQKHLILQERLEMRSLLSTSQTRLKELEQKMAVIKKQLKGTPKTIQLYSETAKNSLVDDAKSRLLDLELREKELLQSFHENVPIVRNIREQIRLVKDFLATQENDRTERVRVGTNDVFQQLEGERLAAEVELKSLKVKIDQYKLQIVQFDNHIQKLDRRERELRVLVREKTMNERNYEVYLSRFEEALISEEMDRQKLANISVIQEAKVPGIPVSPKRSVNAALGIGLGLILGLGVTLFSEHVGQKIYDARRTEWDQALDLLRSSTSKMYEKSLRKKGKRLQTIIKGVR